MEVVLSDFSFGLLIWQIFSLLILIFIIYTIVDLYRSDLENEKKMIWLLAVLFIPLLGCLLYYTLARKPKLNKSQD